MKLKRTQPDPGPVHRHQGREAIANVELDANGTRLVASITVDAVRDLGLAEAARSPR